MRTLSLKAAEKLQASFKGRITSWHDALHEFRGQPRVLIPESAEDVGRALQLAAAAARSVFVRSGRNISTADVGRTAVEDAAVISMEAFRDVEIDDQRRVTVGVAATTADVARKLDGQQLFLPLGDNPTQSIVSATLSIEASPFLRSGSEHGSLRDALIEAEVVPSEGTGAGKAKTLQKKAFQNLLDSDRGAVITKLVFDASVENKNEANRWMQAWMASYEPAAFASLCDKLFGPDGEPMPAGVDLSVRVTSAAYSTKLIIVRITGRGDDDLRGARAIVEKALSEAKLATLGNEPPVIGPGSSIAAWVATGQNSAAVDEVLRRFGSNVAPRPFAKFRQEFLDAVDFNIGADARSGREYAPGVRAWAELQLTADGKVVARAKLVDTDAEPEIAKEARERMAAAIPADKISPTATVSARAVVRRSSDRAFMRDVEVLPNVESTADFDLQPSNWIAPNIIPGFQGEIYQASDGAEYRQIIQQYAVSSYKQPVVTARMTPKYVAMPLDSADVVKAVTYAAANGLKIVTRSGGHQYCGLSSGGSGTLLLDMRLFKDVTISFTAGVPTRITAGPGVPLKDISRELFVNNVTIPHGECPLVNLGGHVQTGGIGHQLRSLGATLDWVSSFKMVTRDPSSPTADVYKEREFTRPADGGNDGPPNDSDVFRAVLGGGPGSWGVLTEITFDLVGDGQYPNSKGYTRTYLYEKKGFIAAMRQLRAWVELQANNSLPSGIDLFISVVSGDLVQTRPGALIVETMCRTTAGSPKINEVVTAVDEAVSPLNRLGAKLASPIKGAAPMSLIAHKGVREIGTFGLPPSGREFDYPYKKSLHITLTPFSDAFIDDFVKLVDNVYNHRGLKVVVQTAVGGGDFKGNGQKRNTHMQRREGLVQLVFDVFYKPGFEAIATQYQAEMKTLLDDFSDDKDIRMCWGTFEDAGSAGAQLDMRRQEVQNFYYDSPDEYARLKDIKTYTDPKDVFHTPFTVQ